MLRKRLVLPGFAALLAVPVAIAVFAAHRADMAAQTSCRMLRTSLLAALEGGAGGPTRRARMHQELGEFQRACALTDPDAKAVFAAFDRAILFAADPDAARSRPVRFIPPPPPPFFGPQGGPPEAPGGPSRRMRERPFGT